jgi:hypothetical protein
MTSVSIANVPSVLLLSLDLLVFLWFLYFDTFCNYLKKMFAGASKSKPQNFQRA